MASNRPAPLLTGAALDAVRHRGSHMQIIASAGSGKTEIVSQRIADLLLDGIAPDAIVAFTFTHRAAEELKGRVVERVAGALGPAMVDRLSGLFVGTIHAYCFTLLQQRVARFESYDVLDDNQLTAFLSREASRLGIRHLDPHGRLFASIEAFRKGIDIVENEMLDPALLPDPFGSIARDYYDTLDRYRLLTYGQQVVRAVRELARPDVAGAIHARLRHLIVDEYQDVNPAQERLIGLLAGPEVDLCVVGDDQQAIYQWRGSDVSNIVTFATRYPGVRTFEITINRRSRPEIIRLANAFASSIPDRIDKVMGSYRPPGEAAEPEAVVWSESTEPDEAARIAALIRDLTSGGLRYRDIAVLVRGRAAYRALADAFASAGIPAQPGGRSGLFEQPEALVLGRTMAWLADIDWRDPRGTAHAVTDTALIADYRRIFGLPGTDVTRLGRLLFEWKSFVADIDGTANLVGEFYELLAVLGVQMWDHADPMTVNRLGTLARFSALLVDYESVRRRARPDPDAPGEQVGGQDRGIWYYRNLALHIINYAQGAYEGFDGEADFVVDAVDLTTIHRAKGLEWPAVFVPSMTSSRFPSTRTGREQQWLLPRGSFPATRYEGSDADERRLFYVAMTRARDWLSVSRHERVTTRRVGPSPYHGELAIEEVKPDRIRVPAIGSGVADSDEPVSVTYSQLAAFMACGMAFRLRELIGFRPRLAAELGYGKAVHHVMRMIAEVTIASGQVPTGSDIEEILTAHFFLPGANKLVHRQLRDAASRLATVYATEYADDLSRVWAAERPFELHLSDVTITGRADVILDHEGGRPAALAIVDYKTSTTGIDDYSLQLQVYAEQNVVGRMLELGITSGIIAAGRPICAMCAETIWDNGFDVGSPLKEY